MRSTFRLLGEPGVLLGLLFVVACRNSTKGVIQAAASPETEQSDSQQAVPKEVKTLTIPVGTELKVRLVDAVGSARNRSGESFLATLDQPIIVDGWVAVPKGTNVTGRVAAAETSGHLEHPAELTLTLAAMQLDGQNIEIETSNYARRGKSHASRNAKFIGGMAGGGALLGALIGRGKGAAIGAGIGAGAGTGTAFATGKSEIYLPPETVIRFTLHQPVTLTLAA